MPRLITKDDDLASSAPVIGFEILKLLAANGDGRISIFDVAQSLRKQNRTSARNLYFGMIFLFATGVIDFKTPYLIITNEA